MKTIVWILVIWIVGSLIYGTVKEGAGWLDPFKAEYRIQLKKHPFATIIVTILVCIVLYMLLF